MQVGIRDGLFGGKKSDPFAAWYPRWGTSDIVLALNGIYNKGIGEDRDDNSQTWTDLANGIVFSRANGANGYAKWGTNRLEFDSTKRLMLGTIPQLSDNNGFSLEVFGYWWTNWGVAVQTFAASGTSQINEVMPYASNTGVLIGIYGISSDAEYTYPSAPSTTDMCLTCDTQGSVVIYVNGEPVKTSTGVSGAMSKVRNLRRIFIGGNHTGIYQPNGSALYGMTIYQDALSAAEVASLYAANVAHYGASAAT